MASVKSMGNFTAALDQIVHNLENASAVEVGFLEDATYPDGTSVAMVAAIQEFGAPSRNIPPRPFFRSMINEKSPTWPSAIAANLRANNFDAEKSLGQIGEGVASQLKDSIQSFNGAPLSPKTIERKGFDKQLIDTGVMIGSVASRVVSE